MASFLYKTKGNSNPKGKPRVFFTCHPDDFEKTFDKICEDIFKTHDCAIYYTKDMTEEIEKKYRESDIGQMNLLVIPVTFNLLSQPNRAINSDLPYAQDKKIPVLPVMMEPGLNTIYSSKDKFGELQYLDPYASDLTAVSYEEKLKKYLESVLISDQMSERIRKAFDAYIFLSYRKKDRHYANKLMKMIHNQLEFRDIAIWYDEFLTPGESFRESIKRMMKDSKLFTLLVTPSLLEYVDGKPNYVMAYEYPDAKKAGMDILPIEMEETDKNELSSKFDGIPECARYSEYQAFKKRLTDTLSRIAISESNDNPEHIFLIGLAYLEGIDVEIDKNRGVALITSAAEANLVEAMEKLCDLNYQGITLPLNYQNAIFWAEKVVEYYKKTNGEENSVTLLSQKNLCEICFDAGEYSKALCTAESLYISCRDVFGENSRNSLLALNNLSLCYSKIDNYLQVAIALAEEAYIQSKENLGEEDTVTLVALNNLVAFHLAKNEYKHALNYLEKAYQLRCTISGEFHKETLIVLNNMALIYGNLGKHAKAIELHQKVYEQRVKTLGDFNPDTISSLHNLSVSYYQAKDYLKALTYGEKSYRFCCDVLTDNHPNTIITLKNLVQVYATLAFEYMHSDDKKQSLEYNDKACDALCNLLEKNYLDSLHLFTLVVDIYNELEEHQQRIKISKLLYEKNLEIKGEDHTDTLVSLKNLAWAYCDMQDYNMAVELLQKLYELTFKNYGAEHPATNGAIELLEYCKDLKNRELT